MTREAFSTSGPDREPIRKNRARTFNEVLADDYPDLAKRLAPAVLPSQAEIDEMVRKAWAKAEQREPINKALPVLLSADPVETIIRKADEGTAHPAEIDALIDSHVRKSMVPEDRGSTARAVDRLAASADKRLSRLYKARQTAARTFGSIRKDAVGRVASRDEAAKEAAQIDAEIKRQATALRRAHPGRFSEAQAYVQVIEADKSLYSAYLEAAMRAKP